MKLKKSLLALTTAATVAVAGTATAVADEIPTANGSSTNNNGGKEDETGGKEDEGQSKLAGSAKKFMGWDEGPFTLEKLAKVVTLITTIGSLVAGLVTLANNFQKIPKLFK
ncbi:hypothetical protein [Corynebacterium macclintockiae]|uniref:hypothetical protein n=1 Tax=Corynebacterium macclintockiae TaxID=2913501 RepID=UPI003EC110CE